MSTGALAACVLAAASPAFAADPCSTLEPDPAAQYADLNQKMIDRYKAEDWPGTIKNILEMRQVCDEDPTLMYNLARAYHQAKDCNKALFWYEQIQSYDMNSPFATLVKDLRNKAAIKVAELELQCKTSALVSIACSDPDVWVELGKEAPRPCGFEDRMEAGKYPLKAMKQGYEAYSMDVDLHAGQTNRITVPPLAPAATGPEVTTGVLKVTCPAGASRVIFRSPSGSQEELDCPLQRDLAPGTYQLSLPGSDATERVVLSAGQTVELTMGSGQTTTQKPGVGVIVGLRVAGGSGLAEGVVYDAEGDEIGELSSIGSSGITLAIVGEVGYALTEAWAILAHGRLDVVNGPLALGALLARWTPWQNGVVAIRANAGFGFGYVPQPVIDETDPDRIGLAWMGPWQAIVGAGVAWNVASPVAVVFEVESLIGFGDLGFHFDWAGVGVELTF